MARFNNADIMTMMNAVKQNPAMLANLNIPESMRSDMLQYATRGREIDAGAFSGIVNTLNQRGGDPINTFLSNVFPQPPPGQSMLQRVQSAIVGNPKTVTPTAPSVVIPGQSVPELATGTEERVITSMPSARMPLPSAQMPDLSSVPYGQTRQRRLVKMGPITPMKESVYPSSIPVKPSSSGHDPSATVVAAPPDLPPTGNRDTILNNVYNYLRNKGRDISFQSVANFASKYKTQGLVALGVAAAAAAIYGGYRLYKWSQGRPGAHSGGPGAPAAEAAKKEIVNTTIKEVLDALAAEHAWIRNNIGTARSILVNGAESGHFEEAVEQLAKTAAGSGLRKKRKHGRGAGVMMV